MLMEEASRLPICQVPYSGSLKDVSTFQTTLAAVDAVRGNKPLLLVMDKGFYSARNIDSLLEDDNKRFIIVVPFTVAFAKKGVSEERDAIDTLENRL
jgi:transposase